MQFEDEKQQATSLLITFVKSGNENEAVKLITKYGEDVLSEDILLLMKESLPIVWKELINNAKTELIESLEECDQDLVLDICNCYGAHVLTEETLLQMKTLLPVVYESVVSHARDKFLQYLNQGNKKMVELLFNGYGARVIRDSYMEALKSLAPHIYLAARKKAPSKYMKSERSSIVLPVSKREDVKKNKEQTLKETEEQMNTKSQLELEEQSGNEVRSSSVALQEGGEAVPPPQQQQQQSQNVLQEGGEPVPPQQQQQSQNVLQKEPVPPQQQQSQNVLQEGGEPVPPQQQEQPQNVLQKEPVPPQQQQQSQNALQKEWIEETREEGALEAQEPTLEEREENDAILRNVEETQIIAAENPQTAVSINPLVSVTKAKPTKCKVKCIPSESRGRECIPPKKREKTVSVIGEEARDSEQKEDLDKKLYDWLDKEIEKISGDPEKLRKYASIVCEELKWVDEHGGVCQKKLVRLLQRIDRYLSFHTERKEDNDKRMEDQELDEPVSNTVLNCRVIIDELKFLLDEIRSTDNEEMRDPSVVRYIYGFLGEIITHLGIGTPEELKEVAKLMAQIEFEVKDRVGQLTRGGSSSSSSLDNRRVNQNRTQGIEDEPPILNRTQFANRNDDDQTEGSRAAPFTISSEPQRDLIQRRNEYYHPSDDSLNYERRDRDEIGAATTSLIRRMKNIGINNKGEYTSNRPSIDLRKIIPYGAARAIDDDEPIVPLYPPSSTMRERMFSDFNNGENKRKLERSMGASQSSDQVPKGVTKRERKRNEMRPKFKWSEIVSNGNDPSHEPMAPLPLPQGTSRMPFVIDDGRELDKGSLFSDFKEAIEKDRESDQRRRQWKNEVTRVAETSYKKLLDDSYYRTVEHKFKGEKPVMYDFPYVMNKFRSLKRIMQKAKAGSTTPSEKETMEHSGGGPSKERSQGETGEIDQECEDKALSVLKDMLRLIREMKETNMPSLSNNDKTKLLDSIEVEMDSYLLKLGPLKEKISYPLELLINLAKAIIEDIRYIIKESIDHGNHRPTEIDLESEAMMQLRLNEIFKVYMRSVQKEEIEEDGIRGWIAELEYVLNSIHERYNILKDRISHSMKEKVDIVSLEIKELRDDIINGVRGENQEYMAYMEELIRTNPIFDINLPWTKEAIDEATGNNSHLSGSSIQGTLPTTTENEEAKEILNEMMSLIGSIGRALTHLIRQSVNDIDEAIRSFDQWLKEQDNKIEPYLYGILLTARHELIVLRRELTSGEEDHEKGMEIERGKPKRKIANREGWRILNDALLLENNIRSSKKSSSGPDLRRHIDNIQRSDMKLDMFLKENNSLLDNDLYRDLVYASKNLKKLLKELESDIKRVSMDHDENMYKEEEEEQENKENGMGISIA